MTATLGVAFRPFAAALLAQRFADSLRRCPAKIETTHAPSSRDRPARRKYILVPRKYHAAFPLYLMTTFSTKLHPALPEYCAVGVH
jgi:hypothetical protein